MEGDENTNLSTDSWQGPQEEKDNNDSFSWSDAVDVCIEASELVGEATGSMYEHIADKAGLGDIPNASEAVGAVVGEFVTENWEDVCNLPENLGNEIKDVFSSEETESNLNLDNQPLINEINDQVDNSYEDSFSSSAVDFQSNSADTSDY